MRFQNCSDAAGNNSFSNAANHSTGHQDEFHS